MSKIYRAMKRESDGLPKVARSARAIGVRTQGKFRDIEVDPDGFVQPHTGGMSVAIDEPRHLPYRRRPPSLGGDGRDPVFEMQSGELLESLFLCIKQAPHGLVEPRKYCRLSEYEGSLAETRKYWRQIRE